MYEWPLTKFIKLILRVQHSRAQGELQDNKTAPRLAGVQLNDVADITSGFPPSRVLLDVQLTDFKFKFLL